MAVPLRNWRWVTRDADHDADLVVIRHDPETPTYWPKGKFYEVIGPMHEVCADEFLDLFGFVPEPGQCLKVEFSAKVIE
jgi:hypothetical protein